MKDEYGVVIVYPEIHSSIDVDIVYPEMYNDPRKHINVAKKIIEGYVNDEDKRRRNEPLKIVTGSTIMVEAIRLWCIANKLKMYVYSRGRYWECIEDAYELEEIYLHPLRRIAFELFRLL